MPNRPTIEQYRHLAARNAHLFPEGTTSSGEVKQGKDGREKSKYSNKRVEVDGEHLDSKREAKRWSELLLLLRTGQIHQLARQVHYELNAGGTHSLLYKADFVYQDKRTGETVVEDAKGFKTKEYKKKRNLMLKVWGITVIEV